MPYKLTTEAEYYEMLGMLPPAYRTGYGFLVGEPMDSFGPGGSFRFTAFVNYCGTFLKSTEPMTLAEFKSGKVGDILDAIRAS